jgi:hypothetical protein
LKRFYDIFEKKEVLEDTIITVLGNLAEFENVKKHKTAALYYYHLLHSPDVSETFKQKLRNESVLEVLKYNPNFSSIFFIQQVEQE